MNVVVCVKQIPDPAAPGALKPDTHTLDRSGKLIMDDSDNYGVEMALQLASGEGDEVTLVSMAPGGETSGLRTGLAMGAAKAILISDDALAGSDALGTAKVLAAAIGRANPDLVVMATESTDGYTGTLPVQVAELMGLPGGTLRAGSPADVIVIDADIPWVLDPADLKSQCKNTPFDEARFSGRVVRTIVGGRTVYEHV